MDLTEAEDSKKRWQEYTEELYKKDLHDPDNHNGVITHLEPDILECKVKWALESITMNKASGCDGISVELFDPERWCCESAALNMPENLENSAVATGLEKISFHSNTKKGNPKERSNYCTIALISHASKVMLKILQARLQHMWTMNFQMFKLVLEKAEEPEIKLPISAGSSKKQEFQKNIYFCFIDHAKAFNCVDHNKLWKILEEMGIPDHLTCLLRNLYAGQEATVRTGHGTDSEKVGLKLNIQKTKIMASGPITSWEIDVEIVETVSDFILGGYKITADGDCSHEIKRCLLLGRKVMTNLAAY